jgi:SsrA-binding protein
MIPIATNKKANFDYQIIDKYVAGLSLSGRMVKQIVQKRVNLIGKFVVFQKNSLQIIGFGNDKLTQNVDLLVTKKEKAKIINSLQIKGNTCVMLNLFRQKRWLKAEIAVVKGKKNYDKKEFLKNQDIKRDMDREIKLR